MSHSEVNRDLPVSLQNVLDKEKLLDIQEKTSLVFLMCDDPAMARYILTKNIECEDDKKIFPELVSYLIKTDQEVVIKFKFLESFILIKNYQVLNQLGFNIDHLKAKFQTRENIRHINCVRKALLRMCEGLTNDELTELILLIEHDFYENGSLFSLRNTKLMEMNLLYLICEDYISDGTNSKESNVKNLIRHLNKMNKYDLAKELEKVYENHNIERVQDIMCPDNDFLEKYHLTVAPKHVNDSDDNDFINDIYEMDKDNMGLCVIINQRDFSKEKCLQNGLEQLSTRIGTDYDRDRLKITFTGLGYSVKILENLDSDSLRQHMRNIVEKDVQQKHSSFVLCILSHGKRDEIYCVDGVGIKVEEIERMISGEKCPQLLGKPKIIFIQACQGREFQKAVLCSPNTHGNDGDLECDGPTKSKRLLKVPPTADMLTFWATVPGYASFRRQNKGSVFIQTLCARLLKDGHSPNHLQDLVRIVNKQLGRTQFGDECYVSMPQVKHTITKKLYFPFSSQHRLKAAQMMYLMFLIEELINVCTVEVGCLQYFKRESLKKTS